MMRPIAWASLIALTAATAASAQSQLVSATLPTESQLERAGLTRQWHAVVPLADVSERVIRISKADNQLFAQTNKGLFYAYDAELGVSTRAARLVFEGISPSPADRDRKGRRSGASARPTTPIGSSST